MIPSSHHSAAAAPAKTKQKQLLKLEVKMD